MDGLRHGGVDATFLGHSTVQLVFDDGPQLLTDPVLRSQLGPLRRRTPEPGIVLRPDAVLISQVDHDHLDLPSLRSLTAAGEPWLVVPAGVGDMLRRQGFRRVEEVRPGDEVRLGQVLVRATPAGHPRLRAPFGRRAVAVGFHIQAATSVYFAGDTALMPGMADLAGDVDLALLPVWGWGPVLGAGRLDPASAAEAAGLVAARVAVPIGPSRFWPSRLRDPGREFAGEVARRRIPVEVRLLSPGESTRVARPRRGTFSGAAASVA